MRHRPLKRRCRPRSGPFGRLDIVRPGRHPGAVAQRGSKRLADETKTARDRLGLTQEEFGLRGPMALKTIQRIEAASIVPRGRTLARLDNAAGWPAGRARAILEGRDVGPRAESTSAEGAPEPLSPDWWLIVRRALADHPQVYAEVTELVHLGQKAAAEGDQAADRA